jgi:hypothetical protein
MEIVSTIDASLPDMSAADSSPTSSVRLVNPVEIDEGSAS